MDPVTKISLWWLLFGGTHVGGSSLPVRTRLISALGLPGFKGLYTVVSLATFIPLVWVYAANKHTGARLFDGAPWMTIVTEVLMVLAFVIVVQGLATPSPITTQAEMSGEYGAGASGIQRVTRHPLNTGAGLMGLAHMISNPFVGDWVFWGGLLAYSVISALHQDARMRATGPDAARKFIDETSAMPFAAILGGRQRLALSELRVPALAISLVLVGVLWWFHGAWFGGFGS